MAFISSRGRLVFPAYKAAHIDTMFCFIAAWEVSARNLVYQLLHDGSNRYHAFHGQFRDWQAILI